MVECYPTYTFRVAQAADAVIMQRLWDDSQAADDPALRLHAGWWSLADWATASYLLLEDGRAIGVAALHFGADTLEAAEVCLALSPSHRLPETAQSLMEAAVALSVASGAAKFHLYLPKLAAWAREAAWIQGFRPVQSQPSYSDDFVEINTWDIWRIPPFPHQPKHILRCCADTP